jgi:hypothetical protein
MVVDPLRMLAAVACVWYSTELCDQYLSEDTIKGGFCQLLRSVCKAFLKLHRQILDEGSAECFAAQTQAPRSEQTETV